jgi:ribosomal RNA methyltransferase Nop2
MCAAPGGKTTYLAQMMRNQGLVVANDFKIKRTNSLMGNIQRLGVKIALVCNYDHHIIIGPCKPGPTII